MVALSPAALVYMMGGLLQHGRTASVARHAWILLTETNTINLILDVLLRGVRYILSLRDSSLCRLTAEDMELGLEPTRFRPAPMPVLFDLVVPRPSLCEDGLLLLLLARLPTLLPRRLFTAGLPGFE